MNSSRSFCYIDEVAIRLNTSEREVVSLILDGKITPSIEIISLIHYEQGIIRGNYEPFAKSNATKYSATNYHTVIDGKWVEFSSERAGLLFNGCFDISLSSENLEQSLKLLRPRLSGTNKMVNADIRLSNPILKNDDGSYIRPIDYVGDGWVSTLSIPDGGALVIKNEYLEAYLADTKGLDLPAQTIKPKDKKPATTAPILGKVYGPQKRSAMAKPIDDIRKGLDEPNNKRVVWETLKALALSSNPPPPIVGYTSEGVQYRGAIFDEKGEPDIYTKKALNGYMDRNPLPVITRIDS